MRNTLNRSPWASDVRVAMIYMIWVFGLVSIASVAPETTPVATVIAMGAAGGVVVLLRRRFPLAMFAAANVLLIAGAVLGTTAEILLPLFTIYAVGVYRSTRTAWVCFAVGSVSAVLSSVVGAALSTNGLIAPSADGGSILSLGSTGAVTGIAVLLSATLIGTSVGARNRYVAALVERAEQLARERDAQAEIARGLERERIAREMHDVIAHSLSVMIALAEGARAAAPERPTDAQQAMERAAETGRRTLGEVRRMLGAVRGDDDPLARAPQPGIDDIASLVADTTRAGLAVTLTTKGVAHRDPALELTLYRLVQESLTNTLRHGSGATRAKVVINWGESAVTVAVDDDGAVTPAPADRPVGRGLIGMRERVALFGGELDAGPGPARGWRVTARIPLERSPA